MSTQSTPALISVEKDSRDAFSCSSHVRQFSYPFLSTLCPLWALHPLTAMLLPEISTVLLMLLVQPASQPSMDLQRLDLKVQLQLMVG